MDKTKYRIFDEDDAWGLVHLLVLQVNLSFDKRKGRAMRTRSGKLRAKEERGNYWLAAAFWNAEANWADVLWPFSSALFWTQYSR